MNGFVVEGNDLLSIQITVIVRAHASCREILSWFA